MSHDRATLEEAERYNRAFAKAIKEKLPKGWHFVLVMANDAAGEGDGMMTYASNIERESCVEMLKELTEKIEGWAEEI